MNQISNQQRALVIPAQMQAVLAGADCLVDATQIAAAIDRLADEVNQALYEQHPIVLCVMNGALIFAGQLLTRLTFPLEIDYCHATRYGAHTLGGELEWKVRPSLPMQDRCVLIVDDILDEGYTLLALKDACQQLGARTIYSTVLCEKLHERKARAGGNKNVQADFCGVQVPDRFVFGCGMDYQGHWRNLPAIYALPLTNATDAP